MLLIRKIFIFLFLLHFVQCISIEYLLENVDRTDPSIVKIHIPHIEFLEIEKNNKSKFNKGFSVQGLCSGKKVVYLRFYFSRAREVWCK